MKRLAWLLTLPLAVAVVVFAVHNRAGVVIDPWPVGPPFSVPLYLIALGAILAGFGAGALVQWAAGGKRRQLARQRNRRLSELERGAGRAEAAPAPRDGANRDTTSPSAPKLLAAGER
ncbi:MAG: LapA family protein [Alphaproteobacteria bacterium]